MIRIHREAVIAAPAERVWGLLVDYEGMPRWFPAQEVIRRRPGAPDPEGVGAARVTRIWGLAIEELVTAFKAQERLEYSVTSGAPVRECRGEVMLTPVAGGTRIRWSVTLQPLLPGTGWLARRIADRVLRHALGGLARFARVD